MFPYDLITIVGPTASGKTAFAARLATLLDAELISGDSRQVYRRMDVGTGKDLDDYDVEGHHVPYHLIDIVEPGTRYNLFRYQQDFGRALDDVRRRGRIAILCGGSGLYVESVLRDYRINPAPQNPALRARLAGKSIDELTAILAQYKTLHNTTDTDSPQRAIRAIEIAEHDRQLALQGGCADTAGGTGQALRSLTLGLDPGRDERRRRITARLKARMGSGMLDEVRGLLAEGIAPDDLIYYGLEYKYLTLCAIGQLDEAEMLRQLEIAIHQFAKRQMTWFRGMERRGTPIRWLPQPPPQNLAETRRYVLAHVPELAPWMADSTQ